MRSFLINKTKTIIMSASQNQINLTIPSGQPSETQNHIEKIFPKSAIKICSFLQLFCAFTACLVQVKHFFQPYFLDIFNNHWFFRFYYGPQIITVQISEIEQVIGELVFTSLYFLEPPEELDFQPFIDLIIARNDYNFCAKNDN